MSSENLPTFDSAQLMDAAASEAEYLRRLSSDADLVLATANLGGYEAVLRLISAGEAGMPVYRLLSSVQSRYTSQAGLLSRIRSMRARGLLEQRTGGKRSEVYLAPSSQLLDRLGPIVADRHDGRLGR